MRLPTLIAILLLTWSALVNANNRIEEYATQTIYNEIGLVGKTIDALGRETTFTYDAQGRQTRVTHSDGLYEETEYDSEGRRTASIDRAGRRTEFTYDELGRLSLTTYANGEVSGTSEYDAAGRVTASIDALGNRTEFAYDAAGRRTSVTNALGQVTSYTYDKSGSQLTMTDALGRVTTNVYDVLNRRTKVIFADNSEKVTEYDALGRRTAETDEEGKRTQFGYDSLGRLTSVTDALNQVTSYEYDELGNQTAQVDALGRRTTYQYDKLGRRVRRVLPEGQYEDLSYNEGGQVLSRKDFIGRTTYFEYDSLGRLESKIPDPVAFPAHPGIHWTYTENGLRKSMIDESGQTDYVYDLRDRLISKATPQGTLTYTWNSLGSLESITSSNSNGTEVAYAYDELNRLSSATTESLGATTYQYTDVGALESVRYPNAVKHSYQYDTLHRLLNTRVVNSATNAILAEYSFTLRPSGHRSQVAEGSGRVVQWQYDSLYRLTQEVITGSLEGKNGTSAWSYDAVGNRQTQNTSISGLASQALSYTDNDLLVGHGYDANGSTTSADGAIYQWNFENRLIQKTGDGQDVQMVYNGDGQLVRKVVGGVTTEYLVDDLNHTGYSQVLEELTNGTVTRVYTYGLDLISQERDDDGDGSFLANFYLYDGFMTVRGLADLAGNVTDTFTFDAWGNLLERTGDSLNAYLYRGERYEEELGLYYNRARYLGVQHGRFWSMDNWEGSLRSPISISKYLYSHDDPVNGLDPSGNYTLTEFGWSVAIAALQVSARVAPTLTRVAVGLSPVIGASLIGALSAFDLYLFASNADFRAQMLFLGPNPAGFVAANLQALTDSLLDIARFTRNATAWISRAQSALPPPQMHPGPFNTNVGPAYPPGGAPPANHTARFKYYDSDRNLVSEWDEISGQMTKSQKGMSFPDGMNSSHTEPKGLTRVYLQSGEILEITGFRPPCPSCQGVMQEASLRGGRAIYGYDAKGEMIFHVWENGTKILP